MEVGSHPNLPARPTTATLNPSESECHTRLSKVSAPAVTAVQSPHVFISATLHGQHAPIDGVPAPSHFIPPSSPFDDLDHTPPATRGRYSGGLAPKQHIQDHNERTLHRT